MSQNDLGDMTSPLSGSTFIDDLLEPWRDALHSTHSGNARPSYVQAGMIWLDTTTNPWILNIFDGADDIKLGDVDTTENTFTPARVASRWAGTAGGTANALTLTPDPALIAAPVAGNAYEFLIGSANTTVSPTLNVSGQGDVEIKQLQGAGTVAIPPYGLEPGVAVVVFDGTNWILINQRVFNKGADIASASTVNLNNATGDYVAVTGTTTINAITLALGLERTVRADGAFTLTHGSSLILPGAANIVAAAGDVFIVRGEESGVARVISYQRASGAPLNFALASSISANGYIRLPGGLTLQWGKTGTVTLDQTFHTITFPTPFLNNCWMVQATLGMATTGSGSIAAVVRNLSVNNFEAAGDFSSVAANGNIHWFAIGN